MPLFVNNSLVAHQDVTVADLVKTHSILKEANDLLHSKDLRTFQNLEKTLYVNQREYAVSHPKDSTISIMGSDDATTCHIVIIRHTGSGATSLGHFDGSSTTQGLWDMLRAVLQLSESTSSQGRLEVHIAGGFLDDKDSSLELTNEIITYLQQTEVNIHLITACCTEFNDKVIAGSIHGPCLYGLGIDIKTGEIFPAQFEDKGPDRALRSIRMFTGDKEMMNAYDYQSGSLKIGPFHYEPWDAAMLLLRLPDEHLLKYTSTSPDVEPPYYAKNVRETLKFVMKYPNSTVHFAGGKPRIYHLDAGVWKPSN